MREERLAAVRKRCRQPAWEPACRKLREEVETFLGEAVTPPDEPAGFYHDYFCPEHAVELVFDAARPDAHPCPVDGKVFSGEPYDAAWRWFINNRLSTAAFRLGLAWRIHEDENCRQRAEEILRGYARRYPGYEPGTERRYGQGKATYQSLDEAVWLIPLARAYDLVRESLSPGAREQVEDDLLRPAARHIVGQKYFRIHNIECWHNAAIAAVGLLLEEDGLTRLAVEDEFGFHHQLAAGVRDDGLWWEGSSSYHFYALAALISLVLVAEGEDDSRWRSERLEKMFRAPVDLAYPDWRLPATNDCWFSTSLLGEVCHGVPPPAGFYEVAYGWYADPVFARVLKRNYQLRPRASLEALLYGRELSEAGRETRPAGVNCEPSGLACWRSQDPPDRQDYLLLKYGPHGGGHGHPDKLSISFYACGFPVSPDLGTPGYGIGLNESWYRQTVSHNTGVVDGRSQPPAEGKLVAFASGEGGDFGAVDAEAAWEEEPYAGVWMRRTVLWTADYFLDLFQVACDRERQIDWVCRLRGELEEKEGTAAAGEVRLEGNGYEHIANPLGGVAEGPVRLQWQLPGGRIAFFLPREEGTEIIQGQVPFNPATETSDLLIRRRRAARTAFLTLVHSWEKEPVIASVAAVDAGLPEGAWALRVDTGKGRHLWMVYERKLEGRFSIPAAGADRVLTYVL